MLYTLKMTTYKLQVTKFRRIIGISVVINLIDGNKTHPYQSSCASIKERSWNIGIISQKKTEILFE